MRQWGDEGTSGYAQGRSSWPQECDLEPGRERPAYCQEDPAQAGAWLPTGTGAGVPAGVGVPTGTGAGVPTGTGASVPAGAGEPTGTGAGVAPHPGYDSLPVLLRAGPGPRPPRPRVAWVARHKAFAAVAAVGAVVIVGSLASAAAAPGRAAGTASAAAASAGVSVGAASWGAASGRAASAGPAGCAGQVRSWINDGAVGQVGAFGGDLDAFAIAAQAFAPDLANGGASAGDVSNIRSAAAAIQSAARAVAASPGPSCVPGLRANLGAAAGDYARAAADAETGMSQYATGNADAATADIDAASSAIGSGNAKLVLATAAISGYEAGQGG